MFSIGTDIVEVDRIKFLIERYGSKFLNRIFSQNEIKYCKKLRYPEIHYAGRFSAKEAVIKALPRGIKQKTLSYSDISISNDKSGKPFVSCGKINSERIDLSISHTKQHAVASAVYFKDDKSS